MTLYVVVTPAHSYVQVHSVWSTRAAAITALQAYEQDFGLWRRGVCVAEGGYIREIELDRG